MGMTEPDPQSQWLQGSLRRKSYVAVNACAALAMASAAMLMPRELRHLYPIALAWFPVAAFLAAGLTCARPLAPWMSFIALGLNIASLVLFILAAYASIADATVGQSGLAYAVPSAAVAGWNLLYLATGLSPD